MFTVRIFYNLYGMREGYHPRSHGKYLLKLPIVLVVKYRRNLLRGPFKEALKASFYHLAKEQDFLIDTIETDKNHVHVLVDIPPTLSAFEVVHRLKGISTYRLWKQYERYLLRYFWKERPLFSDSYFVCSTGEASTETVRQHIASQG